jgi:hypothetical protein
MQVAGVNAGSEFISKIASVFFSGIQKQSILEYPSHPIILYVFSMIACAIFVFT